MGVEIDLNGINDLIAELELMAANAAKVEEEILKAAAAPVLADMQNTIAFKDRTGELRKSLRIGKLKNSKRRGRKFVWVGDVDRKALHGWYVEFGHSQAPARPFIQPALESNQNEVTEIIKTKLMEALE